ncbi:Threonine/homoserine/homoserine lactone efflux protein [Tranquillimonas rosea]|uniref:Threonine/homoserine/homoserine lactone efflux protein n=1 Tax=Tranquillimonas rosea TaxID=641238 RepID=A0A1H9UHM2_9RHOB|nr:LysE family translocator [Tranquillimonas rosea]SES08684.1 Threonine/homoserine/homoserine lactone efflux protein [Tranquillimonas rosea]
MPLDLFFALVGLAIAAAWTPGPNNALVAASGATFGMRRTLPHILGIAVGFPVMVFIVGFFLAEVFQESELLRQAVRLLGAALLLWIAWKVAQGGSGKESGPPRPFTFVEAAAFQWINPKGWSMAIAVTAQFVDGSNPARTAMIVALVFVLVGLGSASTWAFAGHSLIRQLGPERLVWVNRAMAAMIAACVVVLFI